MKWYTMRDFAGELGVCVNTFKTHYLGKYPPKRESGVRKFWTSTQVENAKREILGEAA